MTKYKRFMTAVQRLQGYQKQPTRPAVAASVGARHRAEKGDATAGGRNAVKISMAAMRDLLADLPKDHHGMLTLVCVDGLTYKQAAEALNVPVELMALRMARTRQFLDERIASHLRAGETADRAATRRVASAA